MLPRKLCYGPIILTFHIYIITVIKEIESLSQNKPKTVLPPNNGNDFKEELKWQRCQNFTSR